uniref:VWFA domain-containing protein n=1 Tax=Strongyloides papillosus TaxID=174720 RepID=A0A0N5B989_STREA
MVKLLYTLLLGVIVITNYCHCYYDINIVITLDASEDIGKLPFIGIKATLTSLLKDNILIFQNSTTGAKIGIVYYGSSIEKIYYVNDFSSVEDAIDTIINFKYLSGESESLTTVFRNVRNIINHESYRKNIPSWVIHFTFEPSLDCNYNDYAAACFLTKQLKDNGTIVTIVNLVSDDNTTTPTNEMGSPSYSLSSDNYLVENLNKLMRNISTHNNSTVYSVRGCDKNISSLWLDIIFVIDTSINMEKEGVLSSFGSMISFLSTGFSYNTSDLFYSRLAILTASDNVTVMTQLSDEKNLKDIVGLLHSIEYSTSLSMDTYKALESVENILETDKNGRKDVPTMIVFMTANDNYDCTIASPPKFCSLASRIKDRHNTYIVNIDVAIPENSLFPGHSIASKGMDISNDDYMIGNLVDIALDINCFCPRGFEQFISPNGITKTTECVFWQMIPAGYRSAQYSCSTLNGTLVDVTSMYKFLWLKKFSANMSFWVGLNNMNGLRKFAWDNGNSLVSDSIINSLNTTDDRYSYCVSRTQEGGWESSHCSFSVPSFPYFCQVTGCDTKTNCL